MELTVDESYYWDWAKNLSMSYLDHPPMVAYSIAATTLFSDSELFVRLSALLYSVGISYLFFYLALNLFNSPVIALSSTFLINISLLFFVGGIIITPDTPLVFFWTLFLLLFFKAIHQDSINLWFFAGIALGFALLSKYTAIFIFVSSVIFLVWEKKFRHHIFKPGFFVMSVTGFILFLPV
ncbi:MAG: glycosyltransferase family 39 protein, partial [Nitrospinae bacterium]|nr:glycosyltransferase family 39 protein [Nitrospinota bacterium]